MHSLTKSLKTGRNSICTSQLRQQDTLLQERIRQLEHHYRTVIDNVGDAIFIHDLSGQLLEANQSACDQLGFTRQELLQLNLADIDSPKNQDQIPARIKMLRQEERLYFESEHVRQDGSLIPVEITSRLIEYGEAPAVLSVARDITARKQAEKSYRTLVERSLQGIAVLQNGQVVFANPAISEIGSYTLAEIYNFSPQELLEQVHPEDRERVQQVMQARLAGEEVPAQQEYRVVHKNGSTRWVSSSSTVIDYQGQPALQVAYLDITDHKQAEEALRASEARFRLLVEQARDAFFLITEDGRIVDVNQQACEALGYSRDELLTLSASDIDSRYTFEASQRLWATLDKGETVIIETEQQRKDGSTMPVEINMTKFPVEDEIFLLALARDITQRKQAEETLRQENAFRTSIIKDAAEGLCVCHDVATYPYVEFTIWNDRMVEITGYTMEEINRLGWYQTVYPNPEIRSQAEERMNRMRQGNDLQPNDGKLFGPMGRSGC
jgi:PAS domain S-box-containing protein